MYIEFCIAGCFRGAGRTVLWETLFHGCVGWWNWIFK